VECRDVEAAGCHEVGWDGFVAGGNEYERIPRDDPAVYFHEITKRFPGRENVIHPVMEHGPAVA